MAQSMPIVAQAPLAADSVVVLQPTTWADYQRLLEIRGERSVDFDVLLQFVEMMPMTKAVKAYRAALRQAAPSSR